MLPPDARIFPPPALARNRNLCLLFNFAVSR
jgi:hypothetical protein